jgi:spermidine synthase
MYKYEGLLIYQAHDDDGIIEIVEREGVRSLHFGSSSRQSSMRLSNPQQLALDYARAMVSYLLFKPQLNDEALLIGLGGGSIAKFLLNSQPNCQLKVIEYRQSVVKVARSHFGLPLDSRLKILIGDGADYVKKRTESERERYSVVIIDAFDAEGMAESLCNKEFFEHCKAVLKTDGMLVINLWGGLTNPLFIEVSTWIGQVFKWHTLFLAVKGRGNIIVLAFNYKPQLTLAQLKANANNLTQQHTIDFHDFLHDLKKHNASTFKLLFKE